MNRKTKTILTMILGAIFVTIFLSRSNIPLQITEPAFIYSELDDGYVCDGGYLWDEEGNFFASSYTYTLVGDSYSTDTYKLKYRSFFRFALSSLDSSSKAPFLLQVYLYGMDLPDGFTKQQGASLIGDTVVDFVGNYGELDNSDYNMATLQYLGTIISASSTLENGWYEIDVTEQVQDAVLASQSHIGFRLRVTTDGPPDPPADRVYEDCTRNSQAKYKLNTADSPKQPRLSFTIEIEEKDLPRIYTPELRGLFFHSTDSPSGGRLSDPSYYDPYLDLAVGTLCANWLQISLWYIETDDARFTPSSPVAHCLESVEEVKTFIEHANDRGLEITIRLFDYPYGGGIWSDWNNAGYFNLTNQEVLGNQLAWLQYYIEGLKDANVYSFIVKNEPYWKWDTNPTYQVNRHIHSWCLYMADKVKEYDPECEVTVGLLHPYKQWTAPLDWSNPGSPETVTKFDLVEFHYYGPLDPFESWGDPETITPLKCIETMVEYGETWNRKVYLGEFGYWAYKLDQEGNNTLRVEQYDEVLSACERYPIDGVLSWGFPYRDGYRWNLLNSDGSLNVVGAKLVEYYSAWEIIEPETPEPDLIVIFSGILIGAMCIVIWKQKETEH